MSDWQPIETAPKDGTSILIYEMVQDGGYGIAGWCALGHPCWIAEDGECFSPTHWMPLPSPPVVPTA